jgi:hypothetical protein
MPDHLENASILMLNGNVRFENKIINSQHNIKIDGFDNSALLLQGQMKL